jgi:nucleotide-binding universal stress UspA family protein
MYRQILVPTDGSPASIRAMEHAAHLVQQVNGGLIPMVTVLLVSDPQELRAHVQTPRTPRAERALGMMEKALEEADKHLLARAEQMLQAREVPVTTKRIEGTPASVIAAEAEAGGYDLIVMGSRGLGLKGQSWDILGSVTERVLRSVVCPVLVVKETPTV